MKKHDLHTLFFSLSSSASIIISTAFFNPVTLSTAVASDQPQTTDYDTTTETLVVTATREEQPQHEVSDTVSIFDADEIEAVSPAHPSELLNRSAGVHVNNLGGEGHMTSIRQPITTKGVYLFLENGVPTRPAGLFNHNALYEINMPHAERVEIIKGPGSALYGSDSIGGIINSITHASPEWREFSINPEFGDHGWKRLLTSGGAPINNDFGMRVDLNITENEGFRDESEYSRYATTMRLDGQLSDQTRFNTLLSYTHVDQSGASGLKADDFENNPEKNLYHNDVGRREVDALRLSSEFKYEPNQETLLTVTPFFRDNHMTLMPSWMLNYDPNDRDYQFQSFGLLAKYRQKMPQRNAQLITGLDIDFTPSDYKEIRLSTTRNGAIFVDTTPTGRINYHFEADQLSLSPYLHTEWQLSEAFRISAGLRYDYFRIKYTDKLDPSVTEQQFAVDRFTHLRPDSQTLSYDNVSPKIGVIYQINNHHHLYSNYRHSFRTPSIGQLFRSGSTENTTELKPILTQSLELGLRGQHGRLSYDTTIYHMNIKDDIVTFIDNASNDRKVTNAGKAVHRGIELALNADLTQEWTLHTAWSFTDQEYRDYTAIFGFPATEINYNGNKVGKAPEQLGNLSLQYRPTFLNRTQKDSSRIELEWEHVGDYFTDETNTQSYSGHELLNLRIHHTLTRSVSLYGRLMNATDKQYSTYTSNQVGRDDIDYRPGLPRTLYIGFKATL